MTWLHDGLRLGHGATARPILGSRITDAGELWLLAPDAERRGIGWIPALEAEAELVPTGTPMVSVAVFDRDDRAVIQGGLSLEKREGYPVVASVDNPMWGTVLYFLVGGKIGSRDHRDCLCKSAEEPQAAGRRKAS